MTTVVLAVLVLLGQPLSLEDCLRQALAEHPDVAVAESEVELALTDKVGARAAYLPTLTAQISDGYTFSGAKDAVYVDGQGVPLERDASRDDFHTFGLYLRQTIFDGGAQWNRPERAALGLRRAEQNLTLTRESLGLQVIEAFYGLLGQEESLRVLNVAIELSREQLKLARERKRVGAASAVDVSRAQLALGEDRIAAERQAVNVEAARIRLAQAIGLPPDTPIAIREPARAKPAEPAAVAAVPQDHPQLVANDLDQSLAERDLDLAEAQLWPTVQGSIGFSRQDSDFLKVYSNFDKLYQLTFQVTVSIPIFEGFAAQAAVESAEVRRDRVARVRRQIEADLSSAAVEARRRYERLTAIAGIEAENVRAAEYALTQAEERYRVGDGTSLEVRDAQLGVTRTRLTEIQTRYDREISQALFHQAQGDLLRTYLPEAKSLAARDAPKKPADVSPEVRP